MKYLIALLLITLISVSAFAAIDTDAEISGYRGVVEMIKHRPFLRHQEGSLRLLLASQSVLDTLGLAISAGDSLYVEGIVEGDIILVSRLFNDKGLYILRDFYSGEVRPEASTYHVDAKGCIGCKLCVGNCPTSAIKMVKGKAVIDPALCIECGICIEGIGKFRGCPVRAIKK
ncbi:MAG: 4Fe-4S binding protein [Candidatus Cloacimonadaceae bacterium]|nr:4Fe-4S binding protein [Candidatus Cloacimonadaceae bacterium]MDP3114708.1 4Fe-4S binding protein [Candidatus Cloacimonadaceae bacterium]